MLITLTRTGGFSGIPLTKTIDTTKIDPEKAKEIEELVAKVPKGIEETKRAAKGDPVRNLPKPGAEWYPDRFTYAISIQDELNTQEIKISEETLDEKTKNLISLLQSIEIK